MLNVITSDGPTDTLLAALGGREASLWLHRIPSKIKPEEVARFIGLPWRDVYIGEYNNNLHKFLADDNDIEQIRTRGYMHIIATDPSLINLPPQSLPVYILSSSTSTESEFDKNLRRMSMLGGMRRSGVRHLVIISDEDGTPPAELAAIIDAHFSPFVTFVSETEAGALTSAEWAGGGSSRSIAQLVRQSPSDFVNATYFKYKEIYPSHATVVRFRNIDGTKNIIDLTDIDDAERPVLSFYDILQERDLAPIQPEALREDEFIGFFQGATSWRPFAADVPWFRDFKVPTALKRPLNKLDIVGSPENKIAFIASEPGAGGTTLARAIAFQAAKSGYPTLVAKRIPFVPDPLSLIGYMTRAHQASLSATGARGTSDPEGRPLYETPWVIVFDRTHFDGRQGELRRLLQDLTKAGRPAIVLVVTGPIRPLEFFDSIAIEVSTPSNFISSRDAKEIGKHLNVFLKFYNKSRPLDAWTQFYRNHSVDHIHGVASFWITLSFWLQLSKDISGSIQDWIYNCFIKYSLSDAMKSSILEIAALSSERLSLNENLLPLSDNEWPLSLLLEDQRKNLSAIGLVTVKSDGDRYWGLAHDILGRLLLNALFYDFETRKKLEFSDARDPEHLRFLVLKRVAAKPALAEARHRALAEHFATTIFKIDPDHGARAFAPMWREVLTALDEMPKIFRDNSRVFRHHTAISRRRISALDQRIYGVSFEDQIRLLEQAIEDIRYALVSINRSSDEEPDLNLYNSLANAYLNLADVVSSGNFDSGRAVELRRLASEATHRAYSDNPTNPWVVETHIKNLLSIARSEHARAVEASLEALLAVYDAIRASDANIRAAQLGRLGNEALEILFANTPPPASTDEIRSPLDVLIATWRILAGDGISALDDTLADLSPIAAEKALQILSSPVANGDMHVLRLRYGIISANKPYEFSARLEIVENILATTMRLSPQLRLEYALLLYQVGRNREGDRVFRQLRSLWREGEHFVRVPEPLNWLHANNTAELTTVQAHVSSDQSVRPQALVKEFGNSLVPFRPEEFNVRNLKPGYPLRAHVSFGHNGPFLRPTTAGPKRG